MKEQQPQTEPKYIPNQDTPCPVCGNVHGVIPVYCVNQALLAHRRLCSHLNGWHHSDCPWSAMAAYVALFDNKGGYE